MRQMFSEDISRVMVRAQGIEREGLWAVRLGLGLELGLDTWRGDWSNVKCMETKRCRRGEGGEHWMECLRVPQGSQARASSRDGSRTSPDFVSCCCRQHF